MEEFPTSQDSRLTEGDGKLPVGARGGGPIWKAAGGGEGWRIPLRYSTYLALVVLTPPDGGWDWDWKWSIQA